MSPTRTTVRRDAPAPEPLPLRALLHAACETLALGCLFERRGEAYIRVPVHRRQQLLGCEWHGRRSGGVLRSVSYTFDSTEEWLDLAQEAPGRVVELYRTILGRPDIPASDLVWRSDVFSRGPEGYVPAFRAGSYNPLNAWNTVRGAVHLNGGIEAGFEGLSRPAARLGEMRPVDRLPERGLLFLGGRDVTAAVLSAPRTGGPAGGRRLEAAVPDGEGWSLGDLHLPDGDPFTPLGLFEWLLADRAGFPPGSDLRDAGSPAAMAWGTEGPVLPGYLVMGALLQQVSGRVGQALETA